MEAALRPTGLLESILQHIPAAIAYRDADSTLRWVNPAYLKLLGVPAERVLGRTFPESFPEAAESFMPLLDRIVATREPFEVLAKPFDYAVDGQVRHTHWDISYVPVLDGDAVIGTLSMGIEVSARVENERRHHDELAELRAIDKHKDEFLGVVSHELRTPLNYIMASASILGDGVAGPLTAEQLGHVERILTGSDRMLTQVSDLLDAASVQAGRFQIDPREAAYAPLVEEAVALIQPLYDQKGVALSREIRVASPLRLDAGRIGQVLHNLLANALKFTPAGGTVALRVLEQGGHVLTEVQDSGRGIAEADVPKLFTRFRQLDMSATRDAGGAGLGLAIAKAIVERHGGAIGVRSPGPGAGATVWFRLPL